MRTIGQNRGNFIVDLGFLETLEEDANAVLPCSVAIASDKRGCFMEGLLLEGSEGIVQMV